MAKKRPRIARLDQLRTSRDSEDAIIEFRDPAIATTHLKIAMNSAKGVRIGKMEDDCLILESTCKICGHEVVRLIEPEE